MEAETTEGAQREQQQQQSGRIAITYITLIYASLHVCVCVCMVDLLLLHMYVTHTHVCTYVSFLVFSCNLYFVYISLSRFHSQHAKKQQQKTQTT